VLAQVLTDAVLLELRVRGLLIDPAAPKGLLQVGEVVIKPHGVNRPVWIQLSHERDGLLQEVFAVKVRENIDPDLGVALRVVPQQHVLREVDCALYAIDADHRDALENGGASHLRRIAARASDAKYARVDASKPTFSLPSGSTVVLHMCEVRRRSSGTFVHSVMVQSSLPAFARWR